MVRISWMICIFRIPSFALALPQYGSIVYSENGMSDQLYRQFYKSLSGKGELPLGPDDKEYVPILQDMPEKDPILKLFWRISMAESESVDLLTGFRGNGKSTELKRLKKLLEDDGALVVLVDMTQYIHMTKAVEISDFILSLMAALAVEAEKAHGLEMLTRGYWERLQHFLQTEVDVKDFKISADAVTLGMQLKSEPSFKELLQQKLRGHVTRLVQDAREYVVELVQAIRTQSGNPDHKVVLLVDSVEQIRGVGMEAEAVHNSIVSLFSGHASNLAFRQLHLVYTVPPFLIPLAPNTARNLGGHPVSSWPNIHVRSKAGDADAHGLAIMRQIIEKRFALWATVFEPAQLDRLATSSGGDLRDFFRLVREVLVAKSTALLVGKGDGAGISDAILDSVEGQLRSELLPIPQNDMVWLAKIHQSKTTELQANTDLPTLARFLDSNLIMNYLNGEPWYDIHPLLQREIAKS